MGLVLDILNDVRKQIAATEKVLKEARDRRNLTAESAEEIEGSLRSFRSGSVAHGTVNKPVTDADGGIVLDRRNEKYEKLGPDGEDEGPEDVVNELCDLVRPKVCDEYPKAEVEPSRRGLLVTFNEPLNDEEDPPSITSSRSPGRTRTGSGSPTWTRATGRRRTRRSTPTSSRAVAVSSGHFAPR
jgi:hypothetical protein